MQVVYVCNGFERITEEVCSPKAKYVYFWLKYHLSAVSARKFTFIIQFQRFRRRTRFR